MHQFYVYTPITIKNKLHIYQMNTIEIPFCVWCVFVGNKNWQVQNIPMLDK